MDRRSLSYPMASYSAGLRVEEENTVLPGVYDDGIVFNVTVETD